MQNTEEIFLRIQEQISLIPMTEFNLSKDKQLSFRQKETQSIIEKECGNDLQLQERIRDELQGWGPLRTILEDTEITEILINGPRSIWFEKRGQIFQLPDTFYSLQSYRNTLERVSEASGVFVTHEFPYSEGAFQDFRITLIGASLTGNQHHVSLRRHPKNPWNFQKLLEKKWCTLEHFQFFQNLIQQKRNFLIIGPTGCGKTSVINSLLSLTAPDERSLVIEDTPEIALPNTLSMKLLTREDPQRILPSIDQAQLLKSALRLRPDRLVMGEIRSGEAKDFLMSLATGHAGSFGTLHAKDAHQALIRLEMLIQIGAPQWNLEAIRKLIKLSLDYIIVLGRKNDGSRSFLEAQKIVSLEDSGFLLEPVCFGQQAVL